MEAAIIAPSTARFAAIALALLALIGAVTAWASQRAGAELDLGVVATIAIASWIFFVAALRDR